VAAGGGGSGGGNNVSRNAVQNSTSGSIIAGTTGSNGVTPVGDGGGGGGGGGGGSNSSFIEDKFAKVRPSDSDIDGFVKAYAAKSGVEEDRSSVLKSVMGDNYPSAILDPKRSWTRQQKTVAENRTNKLLADHLKTFHEARSVARVAGMGAVPKTKTEFNRSRRQILARAHPDAGGTARGFAAAQRRLSTLERRLNDLGIPES
jgi:hypothetical protein